MSTSKQPLKYLWSALFDDGYTLRQPSDDRYSRHDDTADHNPSAFRDILDYPANIITFYLGNKSLIYYVNLLSGEFAIGTEGAVLNSFSMEEEPLTDRKLIYFREMHQEFNMNMEGGEPYVNRYCMGYEGKDKDGKVIKKVMYING